MASQTLLNSRATTPRPDDVRLGFQQLAHTGEEVGPALKALAASPRTPRMTELFRSGPAAARLCRPADA